MLVIHPDECIDCKLCVPACPVEAIYADQDLPKDQHEFLAINAAMSQIWPNINVQKAALEEAERWNGIAKKRDLLER
jgi:ferredoxin